MVLDTFLNFCMPGFQCVSIFLFIYFIYGDIKALEYIYIALF